jgi:hypothetical protein
MTLPKLHHKFFETKYKRDCGYDVTICAHPHNKLPQIKFVPFLVRRITCSSEKLCEHTIEDSIHVYYDSLYLIKQSVIQVYILQQLE